MQSPIKQFQSKFIPVALRPPTPKHSSDQQSRDITHALPSAETPANRLTFCEEDFVDFDSTEFAQEAALSPSLKLINQSTEGAWIVQLLSDVH